MLFSRAAQVDSYPQACIPNSTWIHERGILINVFNAEQFYDDYVEKVYKYFYIHCLDRHSAEDLTSQTFVFFLDKIENNQIEDHKKYLYAIMRNVWADYLRLRYKQAFESLDNMEDIDTHVQQTIDGFETKTLKERASLYIDRLPDKQREIAHMRLIQELSPKDIAGQIGRSSFYVKTTQGRAIRNLKKMLDQPETGDLTV